MIRVEVPGLQVSPDGDLDGGYSDDDENTLSTHKNLGNTDPNVALGPDSVGTLSFTSGSTGIPKGVKGRHFSLTHFFPWMGERFGLSESSKFTMLSGIAHDPIQRDSTFFMFLYGQDALTESLYPQCLLPYSSVLNCTSQHRTTLASLDGSRSGWQRAR